VTREGFAAERKRSTSSFGFGGWSGEFLRSHFGGLEVCFMFDSRWLAAYAVLLVFCWCFVVKVIGGRSFETLDPSEVYLAEIFFEIKQTLFAIQT
jgi:hypothetical protein